MHLISPLNKSFVLRFKIDQTENSNTTPSAARAFSFATAHTDLYDSRPKGYKRTPQACTMCRLRSCGTKFLNYIAKNMCNTPTAAAKQPNTSNNTIIVCLLPPCPPMPHCLSPCHDQLRRGGEGGMDRYI